MADVANSAIRTFAIATTSWTAVVTPIDCNYYLIIENATGYPMLRSSDESNANAQYQMAAGSWYSMIAPTNERLIGALSASMPPGSRVRYRAGSTVTWIQAVQSGDTGPVVVEFVL